MNKTQRYKIQFFILYILCIPVKLSFSILCISYLSLWIFCYENCKCDGNIGKTNIRLAWCKIGFIEFYLTRMNKIFYKTQDTRINKIQRYKIRFFILYILCIPVKLSFSILCISYLSLLIFCYENCKCAGNIGKTNIGLAWC